MLNQEKMFEKLIKLFLNKTIGKKEKEEPNLGYEHYFKPEQEPSELPKVYTGWEHYEKEKDKDKTDKS